MKNISQKMQSAEVLPQIGYADSEGRAVVADQYSWVAGFDPKKATVTKLVLDAMNETFKAFGISLVNATFSWDGDASVEQVYGKLRELQLIPDELVLREG